MKKLLGLLLSISALVACWFIFEPDRTAQASGTDLKKKKNQIPGQLDGFRGTQTLSNGKNSPGSGKVNRFVQKSFLPSLTMDLGPLRQTQPLRPNQIGLGRPVGFEKTAFVTVGEDGENLISAMAIRSQGATALRVHFEKVEMSEGESLVVYGLKEDQSPIVYSGNGPFGDGQFWTDVIAGETVIIEWRRPAMRIHVESVVSISEISHLFEQPEAGLNTVGACEVDARCGTQVPERNSVARIVFTSNGQTFVCSGTILGTTNNDKSPFVLTAKSCVGTPAEAQTVQAFWYYQSIACNSNTLQNGIFSSPTGAAILQTDTASDQTFLEILGVIPRDVTFSGWSTQAQINGVSVFSLHHPGSGFPGAENQVESYLRRASGTITGQGQSCAASGLTNGYQATWTEGIAEGGSDGAALWTSSGGSNVLVGVMSGCGQSGCGQPANLQTDNFGRFRDFAPLISSNLAGGSDDAFEPNDTRQSASPVTNLNSSNLIVKQNNEDWYRFTATAGQTIAVSASFTNIFGDIDLELYRNSETTPIVVSDGISNTESINFLNASGTNTFFLRVLLFNDTRNSYNLSLNVADCMFSIDPSSANAPAGGGNGSVSVTASSSGCSWTATSNASWLTITSGAMGTGNGTVGYSVAANTTVQRTGTLTVAGQTFTVTQANGCTYSINPTSTTAAAGGGTGSVTVTAPDSACPWTATSNVAWITITSGASGSGNGTVGYSVAANTGPQRTGTATIAGQTFTVTQSNGCTYSINPTSTTTAAAGGTGSISVTSSDSACAWTATSNVAWITITSGASGSGNGTVGYSVAVNSGPQRMGTATIAGQTFTVTQSNGCSYSINPISTTVAAAGGTGSVTVTASDSACPWTATSNDSFITVTSGAAGTGNGTVGYSVSANTGIQRTGTLIIAGQTFTVTQGDGCQYIVAPTSFDVTWKGGRRTISVTTAGGCPVVSTPNATWITVIPGGPDSLVTVEIARNNGQARTGTVTVAGQTITFNQTARGVSTPGQYRTSNGFVYIRNSNDTGFADREFFYGTANDLPIAGDWDGDGVDTIGIYRNGMFFLRNSNTTGFADLQFSFGVDGDFPIAGDWDGDGVDTIGVVRGNTVFLRNSNSVGNADIQFNYGVSTDVFIAGDWNGDGIDTVGAFRPTNGFVYLRNSNTTGIADIEFFYGIANDRPIAGDWDGDGMDTIGIVRGNGWFLRNSNTSGFADILFFYGVDTDKPITGNWDGQ